MYPENIYLVTPLIPNYVCRNACKAEVDQFPKARYKKFATELEAKAFVTGFDRPGQPGNDRHLFSSPVRSTRRAIVVTPVVHVCVCVCVCVPVPVPVTLC